LAVGTALDDRELLAREPDAAFVDRAPATGIPLLFGPLAAACAQLRVARGELTAASSVLRRAMHAALAALPSSGSFPLAIVAAQHCERADAGGVVHFASAPHTAAPLRVLPPNSLARSCRCALASRPQPAAPRAVSAIRGACAGRRGREFAGS
jgi:hypothetical protein